MGKIWRNFLKDFFNRNTSELIHLDLLHIKGEIWRQFLSNENGKVLNVALVAFFSLVSRYVYKGVASTPAKIEDGEFFDH